MPDALSKTVPIWCTVINLALALRRDNDEDDNDDNDNGTKKEDDRWDTNLYLPPNIVSPSEKAQITALIPAWAAALEVRFVLSKLPSSPSCLAHSSAWATRPYQTR